MGQKQPVLIEQRAAVLSAAASALDYAAAEWLTARAGPDPAYVWVAEAALEKALDEHRRARSRYAKTAKRLRLA